MLRQLAGAVFWSIHCHAAASLAAGIAHAPTGVIHCSCILVNSLPWSSSSDHCHSNVATRELHPAFPTWPPADAGGLSVQPPFTSSSTSCPSDITQSSSFDVSRERQLARTVSASRESPHPVPLTQWPPSGWLAGAGCHNSSCPGHLPIQGPSPTN